jgi:hypothetical protein
LAEDVKEWDDLDKVQKGQSITEEEADALRRKSLIERCKNKVRNLLQKMRRDGLVVSEG